MAEPSTYQSLYRRYRSQRFDQVLGQDHITKALRNAVRDGRVGHAYLFSGPRGTGKTSTARILAKVLNCAAPQDGEPCGECANCLAVERGQDTDWLLEQDAASKSKVDDMRDLLDRVPLGTSGQRKVIILDEVHMLSQGAENALLKTLEEPPAHVVFVLATTDPQKVRPTIRSRTQHFEFHLLSASILADHVRHVIEDADLPLSPDAIDGVVDHVVQAGGGSARDTLSALDQVAALGEVMAHTQPVDAILDAVADRNPGAVLVAVAEAVSTGREPRSLGEALIVRLRDAFLAVMGAGDDQLTAGERERARQLGDKIGPAGLTRALEVLGEALTELARKPDPRIVVEVALVRLARPEADRSLDALAARIDDLERAVRAGVPAAAQPSGPDPSSGGAGPSTSPSPASTAGPGTPPSASPSQDEGGAEQNVPDGGLEPPRQAAGGGGPASAARAVLAKGTGATSPGAAAPEPTATGATQTAAPGTKTGKQTIGAVARSQTAATTTGNPAASSAPTAQPQPQQVSPSPEADQPEAQQQPTSPPGNGAPASTSSSPNPAPSTGGGASPDLTTLQTVWSDTLLGALPVPVRSRWRGGRWQQVADGTARFAVSNEWHRSACEEGRRDVEQALTQHFGAPLAVEVIVDGGGSDGGPGSDESEQAGSPAGAGAGFGAAQAGSGPASVANGSGAGAGSAAGGHAASGSDAEHIDMAEFAELPDADDVATGGVALLVREFGGELITTDRSDA